MVYVTEIKDGSDSPNVMKIETASAFSLSVDSLDNPQPQHHRGHPKDTRLNRIRNEDSSITSLDIINQRNAEDPPSMVSEVENTSSEDQLVDHGKCYYSDTCVSQSESSSIASDPEKTENEIETTCDNTKDTTTVTGPKKGKGTSWFIGGSNSSKEFIPQKDYFFPLTSDCDNTFGRVKKKKCREKITIIHFRSPLATTDQTKKNSLLLKCPKDNEIIKTTEEDDTVLRKTPVKLKTNNLSYETGSTVKNPPKRQGNKIHAKPDAEKLFDDNPAANMLSKMFLLSDQTHNSLGVVTPPPAEDMIFSKCKNTKKSNVKGILGSVLSANKHSPKPGCKDSTEIEIYRPKTGKSKRPFIFQSHQKGVCLPMIEAKELHSRQENKSLHTNSKSLLPPKENTISQINEALTTAIQDLKNKVDELLPVGDDCTLLDSRNQQREGARRNSLTMSLAAHPVQTKLRNVSSSGAAGDSKMLSPHALKNIKSRENSKLGRNVTSANTKIKNTNETKKRRQRNIQFDHKSKVGNKQHFKSGGSNKSESNGTENQTYKQIHLAEKRDKISIKWNTEHGCHCKLPPTLRPDKSIHSNVRVKDTGLFSRKKLPESSINKDTIKRTPPSKFFDEHSLAALRSRFSYSSPYSVNQSELHDGIEGIRKLDKLSEGLWKDSLANKFSTKNENCNKPKPARQVKIL